MSRACLRSGRFLIGAGPGCVRASRGENNPGPVASAYPVDLSSFRAPRATAAVGRESGGRSSRALRPPSNERLRTGTDQGNPTV